jgi:hypothetical protein
MVFASAGAVCWAKIRGELQASTRTRATAKNLRSNTEHHDLGGFDEGGDGLAFFEAELARRVRGDDGGDDLAADGEAHLGHEAFDFKIDNAADELIASADGAHGLAPRRFRPFRLKEQRIELGLGNTVVSAGSFDGAELATVNPLLDRRIGDAEAKRGFAWGKERCHGAILYDIARMPMRIQTIQRACGEC